MSTVDQNGQPVNIATNIPADAWRAIYIIIVVSANFLNVRRFGQFEFWLSTVKILVLVALILFGMGVDAGGSRLRNGETVSPSFGYWKSPHGPMGHAKLVGNDHGVNMFLGFWASMVRVWFSYMGTEQLGAVVGEAKNPRVSVPKAVKRSYRLVIILYVLGIYIVGLTCPSDRKSTFDTSSNANTLSLQGHVSPFKIVANELADKGLGRAINAAIIVFAISGAISNLYTASRVLHGLALDKQAPALLAQVRLGGIPLLAIVVGGSVCTFSFLGHSEENSNAIFDHFVDFTTTAGAISWICILWSHIRFRKGLKAQDYPADTLKYYTSPVYPYGTWFALASAVVFTIFKGVESVALRGPSGFVAAYMLIFWFAFLAAIWWYWKKDPVLSLKRIDLEVEEQEI
ncbi:hypothetical protein CPB86DRAFT_814189 [Serendipita vermifera]|nr:hypothetical protein CPB86DRAFT_814189 [Serendipita vermifera]